MSRASYIFTSESVSEGHPDKVCDRISDAILDHHLKLDPEARCGVETLTATNTIVLAGETRCKEHVTPETMEEIARACVKEIGYEQDGFHHEHLNFTSYVHEQSADIAQGVDEGENKEEGAGDQGMMFGYACRETEELMPAPVHFSHRILENMAKARHNGDVPEFEPDSKSQVTLQYENGKPVRAQAVVVSTQHKEGVSQEKIRDLVRGFVEDVLPSGWMCDDDHFYVNPTGNFVIGGPDGDAGLTGRKIIVDTYGGAACHGGGAFSGKDPTKVDRSAAYAARYLAKNVVAAGLADNCTIQLAYAIGVAKPVSLYVDLHGTGNVEEAKLEQVLDTVMNLTPRGIREHLSMNRPIYERTAAYGHFGRQPDNEGGFSWEQTNLVEAIKAELS